MEGQGKLLDTHSAIASSLIIDLGNGIVSFVCVVWTVEKPESESSVVSFIWSLIRPTVNPTSRLG